MTRGRARTALALAGSLAAVVALAITAAWIFRDALWTAFAVPRVPFDANAAPPAPDYAEPDSWAALPDRFDGADLVPPDSNLQERQQRAAADVFFLHPTTHFRGAHWNAPVDDWLANLVTDRGVLPQQASAFNAAGRVYAPRYRQMTLAGYRDAAQRDAALALAYGDVLRAFDHFVAHWNEDRPILLAGHSQGSQHLARLLVDRFTQGALRERLVAAYAIGARIEAAKGGGGVLPLCSHASQHGCLVAWRAHAADGARARVPADPFLCVNPLDWRTHGRDAPPEANLGALPMVGLRGLSPLRRPGPGARCEGGRLLIHPTPGEGFTRGVREGGDFHAYDYNLFYANLRSNARTRADTFARSRAADQSSRESSRP